MAERRGAISNQDGIETACLGEPVRCAQDRSVASVISLHRNHRAAILGNRAIKRGKRAIAIIAARCESAKIAGSLGDCELDCPLDRLVGNVAHHEYIVTGNRRVVGEGQQRNVSRACLRQNIAHVVTHERAEDEAIAIIYGAACRCACAAGGIICGDTKVVRAGIQQSHRGRIGNRLAHIGIRAGQGHQQRNTVTIGICRQYARAGAGYRRISHRRSAAGHIAICIGNDRAASQGHTAQAHHKEALQITEHACRLRYLSSKRRA